MGFGGVEETDGGCESPREGFVGVWGIDSGGGRGKGGRMEKEGRV